MTTLPPVRRRGRPSSAVTLGVLATVLALWLALTAPSVSPVPAPASFVTAGDGAGTDTAPPVPPVQPVPPVDGRARRGGR